MGPWYVFALEITKEGHRIFHSKTGPDTTTESKGTCTICRPAVVKPA